MSTPALAELKILDAEPGALWMGGWHGVNIVIWLRPATLDVVARVRQALVQRAQLHPLMSSVHIATADSGPPETDARDALVEMNEELASSVACGAVVIERGGLTGVALRSAITGIIILAPKQFRVKVFDAIEPCAPWVVDQHQKRAGVALEADDLLEVLRHSRSAALGR